MNMFHFKQLICGPTRISSTLCTCTAIDLILASDCNKICQSGVIHTSFSDHNLLYCTRKATKLSFGSHNNVTLWYLKNYSKANFQASLLSVDWNPVLLCDSVNEAWERFKHLFVSVIDNIEPVKQLRIKQRTEPLMDSDILQAIKERYSSFDKYRFNKLKNILIVLKFLEIKLRILYIIARKIILQTL